MYEHTRCGVDQPAATFLGHAYQLSQIPRRHDVRIYDKDKIHRADSGDRIETLVQAIRHQTRSQVGSALGELLTMNWMGLDGQDWAMACAAAPTSSASAQTLTSFSFVWSVLLESY